MISPIDKPIKAPILSGEIPRNPWDITKNMGSIGVLGFLEYPGQEIRLKTWGET